MLDFAFFYYNLVGLFAITLNVFIIVASVSSAVRGEFKWAFVGSSLTNILLTLSQLAVMPNVWKWPGNNEFSLVFTSNPILIWLDGTEYLSSWKGESTVCDKLYQAFYVRQLETSVLSICLIPLNRTFAVCWKHIAPSNAKFWVIIAMLPIILPFIMFVVACFMDTTRTSHIIHFETGALELLMTRIEQSAYCSLNSNYRKAGDVVSTIFLIFCPLLSYSIVIFCVVRLFNFLINNQESVRNTVSNRVLQRQKAILATICIQATAPLLIYLPLFLSVIIVDNSWEFGSDSETDWYSMSAVHYMISWSPVIDALATVVCIKPYRKAFCAMFKRNRTSHQPVAFIATGRQTDSPQIKIGSTENGANTHLETVSERVSNRIGTPETIVIGISEQSCVPHLPGAPEDELDTEAVSQKL